MHREEIITFLRDYKAHCGDQYGILSLGIFGSVARGTIRDNSDIDIFVTTRTPDPFALVHMKNDVERKLNRHMDIVRYREKMNPFLKKRIEKEGVRV